MYDNHNKERTRIGVSAIQRQPQLETIVNERGCNRTADWDVVPKTVCTQYGLYSRFWHQMGGSHDWLKDTILQLKPWLEQEKLLVNGECPGGRQCRSYVYAFKKGKRVGCGLKTNCSGESKLVAMCIYCV